MTSQRALWFGEGSKDKRRLEWGPGWETQSWERKNTATENHLHSENQQNNRGVGSTKNARDGTQFERGRSQKEAKGCGFCGNEKKAGERKNGDGVLIGSHTNSSKLN